MLLHFSAKMSWVGKLYHVWTECLYSISPTRQTFSYHTQFSPEVWLTLCVLQSGYGECKPAFAAFHSIKGCIWYYPDIVPLQQGVCFP